VSGPLAAGCMRVLWVRGTGAGGVCGVVRPSQVPPSAWWVRRHKSSLHLGMHRCDKHLAGQHVTSELAVGAGCMSRGFRPKCSD
jgi:hypothetical protein